MIVFSFGHTGRARVAMALPTLLSLASKVRWLYAVPSIALTYAPADLTPLAIVEWTDVFIIIGWTVGAVWTQRSTYSMYIYSQLPASSVLTATASSITLTVDSLFFGTLASCLYFYLAQVRPAWRPTWCGSWCGSWWGSSRRLLVSHWVTRVRSGSKKRK